jgi:hypothetical protein
MHPVFKIGMGYAVFVGGCIVIRQLIDMGVL